jgi:hypothetical protein
MKIQVRASSLGELFDCPARWAARHIDGHKTPGNAFTHIGTAVHAGTAIFDTHNPKYVTTHAVDHAVDAAIERLRDPHGDDGEPINWGDYNRSMAEEIVTNLVTRYCYDFAPHQIYTHVELPVEPLEVPMAGITIELTGTVDRVRLDDEGYGVDDIKTGGRIIWKGGYTPVGRHKLQLAVYQMLAEHTIGEAITARARIVAMQTTDYQIQASMVGEAHNLEDLLRGSATTMGALEHAANLLREGQFYGNPRSEYCKKAYCPIWRHCRYR